MATDITDIQVWPLKKEHPSIKANGSFVVNEAFKVKYTLFKGPKGLFVGLPGRRGDKIDEETKKFPWYPDVTVIDEDVRKQMNTAILSAYNEKTGNTSLNQGEAPGATNQGDNIPF